MTRTSTYLRGALLVASLVSVPAAALALPSVTLQVGGGDPTAPGQVSATIKILALLTVLSLAPAILMLMTCFTRIVIVLSFARQALGVQGMPPTQVMTGLALILTFFLMAPVVREANALGLEPYQAGQLDESAALAAAVKPFKTFMLHHTRAKDLQMFAELAGPAAQTADDDVPLTTLIPAFVTSELTTAFHMGFLVFIPFLLVDFVVASVLMSMGMMMLPPALVSLPLKVMLFVMVDGWHLIIGSIVRSING